MPVYTFEGVSFSPYSARGSLSYTTLPSPMMGVVSLVWFGIAGMNLFVLRRPLFGAGFALVGCVNAYRAIPKQQPRRFELEGSTLTIEKTTHALVGIVPRQEPGRLHLDVPTGTVTFEVDETTDQGRAFVEAVIVACRPGDDREVPDAMATLRPGT